MATDDDLEFEKLLNEFISSQLEDVDIEENTPSKTPQSNKKNDNIQHSQSQDDDEVSPEDKEFEILKDNEKSLMKAYRNFGDALDLLASDFQLNSPKFELSVTMLYPNYKPSVGKIIANDTLAGWDIILKSHPELKGVIHPHATDEEMLNIAEKSDDDALQFALISYVELLIELEGCEISYKERKLKHEKRKLEREIYEEHQKRIARINRYIEALKEKNFPIDAERLVKNYFKTAQKDAEGAYNALTQNPAIFAPIEFNKIKPRFFGLLKVRPQDGIRINRLIGEFLKKLKA